MKKTFLEICRLGLLGVSPLKFFFKKKLILIILDYESLRKNLYSKDV